MSLPIAAVMSGLAQERFRQFSIRLPAAPVRAKAPKDLFIAAETPDLGLPPGRPVGVRDLPEPNLLARGILGAGTAPAALMVAPAVPTAAAMVLEAAPEAKTEPLAMPPALFLAHSHATADVALQRQKTAEFAAVFEGICQAICAAWTKWQAQVAFEDITLRAEFAEGGRLVGPPMAPLMLAHVPMTDLVARKYWLVVASGFGKGWDAWARSVRVGRRQWYPLFRSAKGPVSSAMANDPDTIGALDQNVTSLRAPALTEAMRQAKGPELEHGEPFLVAMAEAIDRTFETWRGTTEVTRAMGQGTVQGYKPPERVYGPVMGKARMAAGGLK